MPDATLLQTIFDVTQDIILVHPFDAGGKPGAFFVVNEAACRQLGYTREEFGELTPVDLIVDEEIADVAPESAVLAETGELVFEKTLVSKSGQTFPVEIRTRIEMIDGQEMAVSTARDITQRKRAERARREALQRLELALDTVQLGMWTLDLASGRLEWNDRQLELYGLSREAFAEDMEAWRTQVHPADRARADERLAEVMDGRSIFGVPFRIVMPDGTSKRIEASAAPVVDEKGGVVQLIGINQDVTERWEAVEAIRASEDLYHSIFDVLSEGLAVQNPDDEVVAANHAAARILGLTMDQLLGKTSRDPRWQALHPDGTPFLPEDHPSMVAMRSKEAVEGILMDLSVGGEERRVISINARPVLDSDGEVLRVAVSFTDVTAETRALAALQESQRELRALAARLQDVREDERAATARELHDELAQTLASLGMDVARVTEVLDPDGEARSILDGMTGLIHDSVVRVRQLCSGLRSPILDVMGLVPAIRGHVDGLQGRVPFSLQRELPADTVPLGLDTRQSLVLFRILQEAIADTARLAGAEHVAVRLRVESDRVVLEVQDDGPARLAAAPGSDASLGIVGMRERMLALGGSLEVAHPPEGGTLVQALLPVSPSTQVASSTPPAL